MDKTLEEFMAAINGGRGDLDAWLECNSEAECRAVIRMAFAAVKEEDARILDARAKRPNDGCWPQKDWDAICRANECAADAIRDSLKEVK